MENLTTNKKIATLSNRLSGIEEYYFSTKLRQIDEMKTLEEEAEKPNQHGYQNYKGSPVLRNAIAKWYQKWYHVTLNPDTEILPLIGSKEGIMHVCMTYINEGDIVLIHNPGYPTYKSAATIQELTFMP